MRRQNGFSLLEVLVAFVILSLSLGALLQVFATGLRNTALAEEYTFATLHAESLMARIGTEYAIETGNDGGEIDDRYRWVSEISEYVEEDDESDGFQRPIKSFRVLVSVFWPASGDRERGLTLETMRVVPNEELQ